MRQIKKRNIRLKTERFLVRTLRETDAGESLAKWLADAELMRNVNVKPQRMIKAQLARFVSSYDQATRLLLGIFAGDTEKLIGYYLIELNPAQRRCTFNVVIGDRDYWGQKVVIETRAALMDYMFAEGGMDKLIGGPLARNFPAIFNYKAQGWKLEGIMKDHVLVADSHGRIDQYQFAMLKDDWAKLKAGGLGASGMARPEKETAS
ncbi:MAG: GNAT family protein [Anderseniella sp.]